jgi:hypothetical protein
VVPSLTAHRPWVKFQFSPRFSGSLLVLDQRLQLVKLWSVLELGKCVLEDFLVTR